MEMSVLCTKCGRAALRGHTCSMCGFIFCSGCFDSGLGLCSSCSALVRRKK